MTRRSMVGGELDGKMCCQNTPFGIYVKGGRECSKDENIAKNDKGVDC